MSFSLRRLTRRDLIKASAAGAAGAAVAGCGWCLDTPSTSAQGKAWKITLVQGVKGDEFYISMACGAGQAAQARGAQLTVDGPQQFDATLQTPLLAAVVQSKPDAILIAPNDRTAMIAPIQEAINAGIAVFTVDTFIESPIAISNIASDNVEGGRIAGDSLAKLIGEKGSVYVTNVKAGISTTDQRQQGFEEAIKKYPNIKYLGAEYNNDDPTTAASQTSAILQANPDLAGIFGTNLFGAEGAATAVQEAGKTGQVRIVGFDAGPKQVQDLKNGVVDELIAQHPYDIGYVATNLAIDYLNTKVPPPSKVYTTGYTVVTRDNLTDPAVEHFLYVADCGTIPPGASPVAVPASPTP